MREILGMVQVFYMVNYNFMVVSFLGFIFDGKKENKKCFFKEDIVQKVDFLDFFFSGFRFKVNWFMQFFSFQF